MAKESRPAFQFYPRDFMGDPNVQAMDWYARGVYIWLLCLLWCEVYLPADPAELARILHMSVFKFEKVWQRIGKCFTTDENGMLRHPRLDRQRAEHNKFLEQCSLAGKESARKRAEKGKVSPTDPEETLNPPSTDVATSVQPEGNSASASATATATATAEHTHIACAPSSIPRVADLNSDDRPSERFEEAWKLWPLKIEKDAAARAWQSVVTLSQEQAVFACIGRYLASDQVSRGVVSKLANWLFQAHRDTWACEWPAGRTEERTGDLPEWRGWKKEEPNPYRKAWDVK